MRLKKKRNSQKNNKQAWEKNKKKNLRCRFFSVFLFLACNKTKTCLVLGGLMWWVAVLCVSFQGQQGRGTKYFILGRINSYSIVGRAAICIHNAPWQTSRNKISWFCSSVTICVFTALRWSLVSVCLCSSAIICTYHCICVCVWDGEQDGRVMLTNLMVYSSRSHTPNIFFHLLTPIFVSFCLIFFCLLFSFHTSVPKSLAHSSLTGRKGLSHSFVRKQTMPAGTGRQIKCPYKK